MIEIAMRRNGARLMPVDEMSAEELVRVPANRDVLVKIVSPRNLKLMRFLWALAGKVADACEWLHDKDDAMDELKIRARHVKYLVNPTTGEVRIVPKSLSKLDGGALNRLANRMVYIVCRDVIPGLDESALRAEIVSMVSGPGDSNSSQASPSETNEPAAETAPQPHAAGDTSETILPDGWSILYANALRRAQKKPSLKTLATQFWEQHGGWDAHKAGADAPTAKAIFDAFNDNFGNKEQIESVLRELMESAGA